MKSKKNQKEVQRDFAFIELSLIDKSSFNPRKTFDENSLNELSQSIREKGVIQPIVLRPVGDRYEVVCGERRYRAAVLAELTVIPACIKNLSDEETEEFAITENLQRKDVSPLEEAEAFSKLVATGKYDVNSLAVKFGKSEAFIRGRLKLVNLITEFRDMLEQEIINIGVAGVFASYPADLQNEIYTEHLAADCPPYKSWTEYRANRMQAAIEQAYYTKLDEYSFDKEECKNCPFNTATFSLFAEEGVGTCTKRECLTDKNTMYIYQQVIDMQNTNPELGICKHSYFDSNANVIEKLEENGFEVQTVNTTDDNEEPELPCRDDYEDDEDFNDAMSEYEDAIAERNALVAAGEMRPCIQVQKNGVKIVYTKVPKGDYGRENAVEDSSTVEDVRKNPEIIKLQNKMSRNDEICNEKIVEKQKELVKSMDVPSDELHEEEVALMYLYMIRKMRENVFERLGLDKAQFSVKYTDLLELTAEQKSLITREFAISHLEQFYGKLEARKDNPLRMFLNFHVAEQVENIDKELVATYKKRNDRLQERIDAMGEASESSEDEVDTPVESEQD